MELKRQPGFVVFVVFSLILTHCNCSRLFKNGRKKGGMLGSPPNNFGGDLPPDQWHIQRLNHFNDADSTTWKQRYFVNDTFYAPGGPVFLMIGGEGTASPAWMVQGAWIEYAKRYNALCFQLEHRFYGKSHPTPDMSTENLAYLSSEQALADLAHFRVSMGKKFNVTDAKWIAFGGSYPGSLAAWVRMKYPHLIHGSVSTSGPLLAKLNFVEYLAVVKQSLDSVQTSCNVFIGEATVALLTMMQTQEGRATVSEAFNLCKPIDIKMQNDVATLYEALAGNFMDIVQYNKDNKAFEGHGTNVTIETLCGIMADTTLGKPWQRYAAVNSLYLKNHKEKCLDVSYDNMIKEMQQTSWNSSASEGGRQWTYQTCTEFGFYQSSDLQDQPFGHKFPLQYSTQQCSDIFGAKFTAEVIENGILRTNTNYGALGLKVTRVIFPNGSIDPWHALGVTKDLSPDATAIFINGTAHCANMYPASAADLPQLTAARITIENTIGKWLMED